AASNCREKIPQTDHLTLGTITGGWSSEYRKGERRIEIYPHWMDWTPDGKAFIIHEFQGNLRRVESETFRETHQLNLGKNLTISKSAEGLLFCARTGRPDNPLILVDYDTLEPVQHIEGVWGVNGRESLTTAVGFDEKWKHIFQFEVKTGKILAASKVEGLLDDLDRLGHRKISYQSGFLCALLPDGQAMHFVTLPYECGVTGILKIEGKGIVLDEERFVSPTGEGRAEHNSVMTVFERYPSSEVSPDGQHLLAGVGSESNAKQRIQKVGLPLKGDELNGNLIRISRSGRFFIVKTMRGDRGSNSKLTVMNRGKVELEHDLKVTALDIAPHPVDESRILIYARGVGTLEQRIPLGK
ncbi:MAG: hypothetical protein KDA68_08150, partial [Planctomycetaceae bacterium]|nr:hypothetical protein [Planctomycetaceae bacterium]